MTDRSSRRRPAARDNDNPTNTDDAQASAAEPDILPPLDDLRILRIGAVSAAAGLAVPTIYRMVANGTFPSPVRLSRRHVGWYSGDVRRWLAERPATSIRLQPGVQPWRPRDDEGAGQ